MRRVSLDAALVELAEESGATMLLGRKVTGLVGSATTGDPVRGVVLDDGRELRARWVLGADGQRSSVAHHLGLERVAGAPGRAGDAARLLARAAGFGLDPPGHARAVGVHGRALRGRHPPAHGRRTRRPDPRHSRSHRGSLPPGSPGLPGGAEPAPARGRRAGLTGGRRTGDDDARLLPLRDGPAAGPSSATPGTSSTRPRGRASGTPWPRPSTSPWTCSAAAT